VSPRTKSKQKRGEESHNKRGDHASLSTVRKEAKNQIPLNPGKKGANISSTTKEKRRREGFTKVAGSPEAP